MAQSTLTKPAGSLQTVLSLLGLGGGVVLSLILLVQGLAVLTRTLSGTADLTRRDLSTFIATPPPSTKGKTHALAEWPASRGRTFQESPLLAEQVRSGALTPVAERLPENPLVVVPPERLGPYGGTWVQFGTSPGDISLYRHRVAYEGLLRFDPMGREIWPNLAWKWESSEGGRVYTIHLRRGVRWSDGHPFTADDVVFWYQDVLLNDKITPGVGPDLRRGGKVVEVEKLDAFTLRFTFKEPHGLFPELLAGETGYDMVSYPAHYLKAFHANYCPPEKLTDQTKAGGCDFWYQLFSAMSSWRNPEMPVLWAWVLKRPPPARPTLFERNPYYWKVDPQGRQLPYLDKVTYDIYDPETINLKAIHGEIGTQSRHLHFSNYQLFMANRTKGGYRVLTWLDGGTGNLALCPNLNHKDPVLAQIFGDRRFRLALSHALNRPEMNEVLYFGLGRPRQIAPAAFSKYHDPAFEQAHLRYDPDYANRLLNEMGLTRRDSAGFRLRPDGKTLAVQVEVTADIQGTKVLEMVCEYWRRVGIKADLRVLARQLYKTRQTGLVHDIAVWPGAGAIDPLLDPRFFLPYSQASLQAIGYAQYFRSRGQKGPKPPAPLLECMDIFRKTQVTADEAERRRLVRRLMDLNQENLWVIGLIGDVPQINLVRDDFFNVPELAVSGWEVHSPGNTAPECYVQAKEG